MYHNHNSINCQIQQQSFLKRNESFYLTPLCQHRYNDSDLMKMKLKIWMEQDGLAILPQQHNSACATWLLLTVLLLSRNLCGTSPGISSMMIVRSINAFLHFLRHLMNRFFAGFEFIADTILLTFKFNNVS